MRSKVIVYTAMGMLAAMVSSYGQVVVGSEDFESYALGTWDVLSAPDADPALLGGALTNNIIDDGGSNQLLQVDCNLINQWIGGVGFDLDLTNNVSWNVADYTLDVFVRFDPSSVTNLTNVTFEVLAFDPDNYNNGSHLWPTQWDTNGYAQAKTNGYTFSIPIGWGGTTGNKLLDPSLSTWRLQFYCGNQSQTNSKPITFFIDDVSVKYTEPQFLNPSGSPVNFQPTNTFTLSGTVIDGTLEVDAMQLMLDGLVVASNNTYAGGSTTNTITFNAVDVETGKVHTGAVLAQDSTGTNTVYHEWEFYVAGTPAPPSDTPLAVYNFNHAGCDDPNFSKASFPVSNGVIAAAPPFGSNNWYNAIDPNPWYSGDSYWEGVEANGSGTWSNITVNLKFANNAFVYVPWTWGNDVEGFEFAASNTIWGGSLGGAGLNSELDITGLDAGLTYDLYLYFVCPNATTSTTTYAIAAGYAPVMEKQLVSDQSVMFDGVFFTNSYELDTNYVVLTEVMPVDGTIGLVITADSVGGGLSAFQLVARKPAASVVPNVLSMVLSGSMANLSWDSQKYISYNVLGKAALTDASWTTVTNVPGADGGTSASVPISTDQAFFMIEGN